MSPANTPTRVGRSPKRGGNGATKPASAKKPIACDAPPAAEDSTEWELLSSCLSAMEELPDVDDDDLTDIVHGDAFNFVDTLDRDIDDLPTPLNSPRAKRPRAVSLQPSPSHTQHRRSKRRAVLASARAELLTSQEICDAVADLSPNASPLTAMRPFATRAAMRAHLLDDAARPTTPVDGNRRCRAAPNAPQRPAMCSFAPRPTGTICRRISFSTPSPTPDDVRVHMEQTRASPTTSRRSASPFQTGKSAFASTHSLRVINRMVNKRQVSTRSRARAASTTKSSMRTRTSSSFGASVAAAGSRGGGKTVVKAEGPEVVAKPTSLVVGEVEPLPVPDPAPSPTVPSKAGASGNLVFGGIGSGTLLSCGFTVTKTTSWSRASSPALSNSSAIATASAAAADDAARKLDPKRGVLKFSFGSRS